MPSLPICLAALYLLASLISFVDHARDKHAARRRARRTPESRLLLVALLGGWPGGLLAQHGLRHKTAKASFRWRFRGVVVANLALLAAGVLSFQQYF